ncbi:MAG: hypothetical protein KAS38_04360, partial [Anaerolineales bacterium]|nr:hypothetical protein [Anaerolineales bacterium]
MSRITNITLIGLLVMAVIMAACAQPTPETITEEIIVTEIVEVEKEVVVTEVVEVEKIITPTPEPGRQTLIVGMASAPIALDPADHRSREAETVLRNMFDGLVTRDNRSGVHPEIAEEMNWLDEQTLEIKLREGVMFHDGTAMTADDVVYTFERVIMDNMIEFPEPHTSPRKGLIAPLESIEKVDDNTVVMHFSAAWPPA